MIIDFGLQTIFSPKRKEFSQNKKHNEDVQQRFDLNILSKKLCQVTYWLISTTKKAIKNTKQSSFKILVITTFLLRVMVRFTATLTP